ncbi:LysM peptidoglycan-binding domain-containing protein [Ilumatobacter sp.]|uniref:LysM peptidoglycan-binding domain-containing protein n=1 Tax=Ilumatobacter sp. TaxID=1967498 RepID=UPI003B522DD3
MNNTKTLALRIGAAALLLVIVVAPPVGVAALVGRPYPEWATLSNEIEAGQVSVDTVMRIAAALFIGLWVWLVATIAGEVFRIINTRRANSTAPIRARQEPVGSAGVGALHRLVRVALLGTVTTAATVSTWSSAVVATSPTLASLTRTDTPISAPADPADAVPAAPSTTTIVADGRSTPLSVAVDLGDENLRDDIVAMNRSSQWASGVFPAGMLITIPIVETEIATAPPAEDAATRYVVQDNDGMWNVAEALLGDGTRHHELRLQLIGQEVAPGVIFTADTHVIHPGWEFSIPESPPATNLTSVEVQRGDSLSRLADQHLGDPDRWPEIWELNANRTMTDGRTFDDPDLILPGWQLTLSQPTPDVEPPAAPASEAPDDPPTSRETPAPAESPEPDDATPSPTPVVPRSSAEPTGTPVVAEPSINGQVPAPTSPPTTLPPPSTAPTTSDSNSAEKSATSVWSTTDRSIWPHLTVGALLVAGLAETIRRLRNRRLSRLTPGHRLTDPSGVAAGTEHAIRRADTTPIRTTIHGLLRSLTPYAAEQSDPPAVRAVQIGTDRVEVLFSKPAPMPPTGWSTIDGGNSWTHRIEDSTGESRQLLTPALVTIGVRTDEANDEVLLDLETAGSLTIAGDRDSSLGLARSVALELATYPLGVSMDVCLIGLSVDGTELCDRVWHDTTMTRAVRVAKQRLDRSATEGTTNIVATRGGLDEDDGAHDPHVFVVDLDALDDDDRSLVDDLVRLCQPSTGTVAVVVGDHDDAHERIHVYADGT